MIKGIISELNSAMYNHQIEMCVVEALLLQLTKLTGKTYDIISRRVVYWENGELHDAFANC